VTRQEQPPPSQGPATATDSIEVDRGTVNYALAGPPGAPCVLILPGAFTAPWQYDGVRDHLAQRFRAITLDYRGIAGSRNDLWHITPAVLARDTLELLDHLDVAEVSVACISLGTFVLAELLHIAPSRIVRCAIGAMPALRRHGNILDAELDDAPKLARSNESSHQIVIRSLAPRLWSRAFRETQHERYHEAMARMNELTVRDVWTGVQQFQGVFSHDWSRTLVYGALPEGRRLFLTGDADPFAPIEDVRDHPLYRLGPTVVFRDSGHLFLYERAEAYNAVVSHFFSTGELLVPLPGASQLASLRTLKAAA
jgi:pimeloyl-ACP methyl ester carboxylesterase